MIKLKLNSDGLIPAVMQDHRTGEVLMVAYMNREAFSRTLKTGRAWFYSRSRNKLWMKGESSGNVQTVRAVYLDCDNDCLLLKIIQKGDSACHTGYRSCFYRKVTPARTLRVTGKKIFDPDEVYGKKTEKGARKDWRKPK